MRKQEVEKIVKKIYEDHPTVELEECWIDEEGIGIDLNDPTPLTDEDQEIVGKKSLPLIQEIVKRLESKNVWKFSDEEIDIDVKIYTGGNTGIRIQTKLLTQ